MKRYITPQEKLFIPQKDGIGSATFKCSSTEWIPSKKYSMKSGGREGFTEPWQTLLEPGEG